MNNEDVQGAPLEDDPQSDDTTPDSSGEAPEPIQEQADQQGAEEAAAEAIAASLVSLGFVSFDGAGTDNETTGLMAAAERRRHFRRDVYVGIRDEEQETEFLGRIVEGPFHAPHEIGSDSAITRTTLLHPERTAFRPAYYVHGSIEVLGEIRDGERVVPTPTRPRPYSEIYIFPADRLKRMLGLVGEFHLGHLMGYEGVSVEADIDNKNFLPRNMGIFGTVGSGKSNSVQVFMEEAIDKGWAVVVVDVEGEYVRMDEPTGDSAMAATLAEAFAMTPAGVPDLQVYVPSSGTSDAESPHRFKAPISAVETEVISDILELTEPQVRMFGRIMGNAARSSRGAQASRTGVLSGTSAQTPSRPFTLQTLIDGLDEDQNFPLLGGNIQSHERSTAYTLKGKLIRLGVSGMLDWNATSGVPELPVLDLLVPGRLSVIDVSETDDRSRNIAISYVLQTLFDQVLQVDRGEPLSNGQPRPPVLVVIEEVHTFVSRAAAPKMRAVIDQLQLISRRGRKRWMGLALVSQQPGHVPDELFELANTRIIHQLKSAANLAPVKQTTGGVHEALWGTVPALGPGQCLLTGATFRNPIFVTMRPAQSRRLLVT